MEPAEKDLKNLFIIFYEVFKFCEGFYSNSDMYTLFKSAKLLEDTYLKLHSIGALNDFEDKLNEFWALKGLKSISLKFFQKVTHEVLARLLTDTRFSNDTVKSALSEFLKLNSEQDFLEVVKRLYYTNQSVDILKQSCKNNDDYNALISLEEMSKYLAFGVVTVEESTSLLTSLVSRDTNNFKMCLSLLCNSNVCSTFDNLQELIMVIAKFLSNPDNVHLYPVIFELSETEFCQIVTSWNPILESFIKIIEYSIVKLKCCYSHNSYSWINSDVENSLTFEDITKLITKLKLAPTICDKLQDCLNQLKQEGHGIVVEDILRSAGCNSLIMK